MRKINLIILIAIVIQVMQCSQIFGASRSSTVDQETQIELVHKAFESNNITLLEQYRKEFLDNNIQILIAEALTQIDVAEKKETLHFAEDIADALPTAQKVTKNLSHPKIGKSEKTKKKEQYLTCSRETEKHIRDILSNENIYPALQNEILRYFTKYEHSKTLIGNYTVISDFPVSFLCELKDGVLASSTMDTRIKIWDVQTGECLRTLSDHTKTIRSLSTFENQDYLLSSSYDGTIKIWDVQTATCLRTLYDVEPKLCVLKNGNIASGPLGGGIIKIWDSKTGNCLHELNHNGLIYSLTELDNNKLVSVSTIYNPNSVSLVKIWDLNTGNCLKTCESPLIYKALQLPNNNLALVRSPDGISPITKIEIWDNKLSKRIHELGEHLYPIVEMLITPEGNLISCDYKEVKIWSLKTYECLLTIKINNATYITSMCVLKNGNFALGLHSGKIEIYEKVLDVQDFSKKSKLLNYISQKLYTLVGFMRLCKRKS